MGKNTNVKTAAFDRYCHYFATSNYSMLHFKKLYILVILILYMPATLLAYDREVIRQYYHYVYSAEQYIIHKQYSKASACYDTAFATDFKPFSTDIYNSAVCAVYNNDNPALLYLAKMLIDKGAGLDYFNRPLFKSFRQSPEWQKLVAETPDLIKQRYEHLDTALVKRLNDFTYRSEMLHKSEFKDQDEVLYLVRLHHIDDSLKERLYSLMEENDYLSEELIGAFRDSDLSVIPLYAGLADYQFQKYPAAMRLAIANAVKRGKLRAGTGITWLAEHSDRPRLRYTDNYLVIDDTLWVLDNPYMIRTRPETVELLTDDDDATRFIRQSHYMDEPANIIEKLKFSYHEALKAKKKQERTPFHIYEPLRFTNNNMPNHDASFKIVDVP